MNREKEQGLRSVFEGLGVGNEPVLILPRYQVRFHPMLWRGLTRSGMADCYTYGLDLPEVGAGALGCLSAHENHGCSYHSVADVQALLIRDQLQYFEELPNDQSHVIAVFYGPRAGFGGAGIHCYRRDLGGWSHLYDTGGCGGTDGDPARTDFSGQVIIDPLTCDRGLYTDFAGYWAIPYDGILVRPKLSLDTLHGTSARASGHQRFPA